MNSALLSESISVVKLVRGSCPNIRYPCVAERGAHGGTVKMAATIEA